MGLPVTQYLVSKEDVVFDLRKYNCTYGFLADVWEWLKPVSFVLMGTVPSVAIIVTTVLLLKKAAKITKNTLRWQGSITLVLVAGVYSVAILPYNTFGLVEPFLKSGQWESYPLLWYRTSCALLSVNVMANFFIYCLTVGSFRTFLMDRFRGMVGLWSNNIVSVGTFTE